MKTFVMAWVFGWISMLGLGRAPTPLLLEDPCQTCGDVLESGVDGYGVPFCPGSAALFGDLWACEANACHVECMGRYGFGRVSTTPACEFCLLNWCGDQYDPCDEQRQ